MIITDIVIQKNNDRVNIYTDGEFKIGVSIYLCEEYSLKVGNKLTEETLSKLQDDDTFIKAKNMAFRYLSYRDRTQKEMRDYLNKKEYHQSIVELVIKYLLEKQYLNDERFTQMYIEGKSKNNNYGPKKIKFDLLNKGIDKVLIDEALQDFDEDMEEIIELVNKKYSKLKDADYNKQYNSIGGFLARKGHSYDTIKKVIQAFRSGGE